MTSLSTLYASASIPHLGWALYVLPEVGQGVVGWKEDLAVLLNQFGEVQEQWMLLTKEVKLVVTLQVG